VVAECSKLVREPLVVLDSDLRVQGASRSFYQTFSVTKEESAAKSLIGMVGLSRPEVPQDRERPS
jgi:hypothetical protein